MPSASPVVASPVAGCPGRAARVPVMADQKAAASPALTVTCTVSAAADTPVTLTPGTAAAVLATAAVPAAVADWSTTGSSAPDPVSPCAASQARSNRPGSTCPAVISGSASDGIAWSDVVPLALAIPVMRTPWSPPTADAGAFTVYRPAPVVWGCT